MILDSRNEFCDATALNTGAAGTYLIGSQVDTSLANNVNDVDELYLVISVDTAVTSGGSATVQFHLASDDSASIATDGSATYHWSSPAIPKATLVAGYYVAKVELPKGDYERYLGILQTTGTAALTAGKVNAFLTKTPVTWKAYTDQF
jgi:hypothetical protein